MIHILLVEDDVMLQEILSERLSLRNFQVSIAENGQEGIIKAQTETPDIILMDMRLPVMDGWKAAKELKTAPETAHIPIIALTAHALIGDREDALAAGCDEYEAKPVDFTQLLAKIDRLLKKK
ncbi:MAG: response regulator [Chloroflexi bacterium]|nr:response regulator [Chloroflexota bacterium]